MSRGMQLPYKAYVMAFLQNDLFLVFTHVMRRPCWPCTKQWQNVAQVLHNNSIKFPKDCFRYCSVHQNGRRDVTWKPRNEWKFHFCFLCLFVLVFVLNALISFEKHCREFCKWFKICFFLYRFWSWRIIRSCLKLTTPWKLLDVRSMQGARPHWILLLSLRLNLM